MFNTFDIEDVDPSEKNRILELDNGVVIKAVQKDPFGFLVSNVHVLYNFLQGK